MTVRLNFAPAAPARTESLEVPADQRGADGSPRKAAVLALGKLLNQHEPARDGNQHKG